MNESGEQSVARTRRRGAPVILLGLLMAGWISTRAMMWESPFPAVLPDFAATDESVPSTSALAARTQPTDAEMAQAVAFDTSAPLEEQFLANGAGHFQRGGLVVSGGGNWNGTFDPLRGGSFGYAPTNRLSAPHYLLMQAAYSAEDRMLGVFGGGSAQQDARGVPRAAPPSAPFSPKPAKSDRWSLEAFSFFRAGSGGDAISAGRVAIYGASQSGARLQYRIAPSWGLDPRVYVRAYQAMVSGGETEAAAGLSARPLAAVPVRAYGEVRVTDTALFGRTIRPAAYAVTELPPIPLPLDVALELYGGAGYVGGVGATPFADGQAVASREMLRVKPFGDNPMRLSVGGGAWGGVQRDAGRFDIGPTLRLDFDLGDVPARVSVDWRERILGDAEPGSGVAATLSTQF